MNIATCRECEEEIMNAQHGDCFINSKDLLRVTFKSVMKEENVAVDKEEQALSLS